MPNNTEVPVSRHENQNKNRKKNDVTSTVNLALHKDFILKTLKREVRLE